MSKPTAKTKKIIIPVTGMTCASCSVTVEKALSQLDGVSGAFVNLASEKASVEYDPNKLSAKTLAATISDTGYGVALEKKTFGVTGMSCASCAANIEKALVKVAGVISVNVNLATEKATVEFPAGTVTMADLKKAVVEAGFGVIEADAKEGAPQPDEITETTRRELRTLRRKHERLENEIGKVEAELARLYAEITAAGEAGELARVESLGKEYAGKDARLKEMWEEWARTGEELE